MLSLFDLARQYALRDKKLIKHDKIVENLSLVGVVTYQLELVVVCGTCWSTRPHLLREASARTSTKDIDGDTLFTVLLEVCLKYSQTFISRIMRNE